LGQEREVVPDRGGVERTVGGEDCGGHGATP
jgi:hypothetical protein